MNAGHIYGKLTKLQRWVILYTHSLAKYMQIWICERNQIPLTKMCQNGGTWIPIYNNRQLVLLFTILPVGNIGHSSNRLAAHSEHSIVAWPGFGQSNMYQAMSISIAQSNTLISPWVGPNLIDANFLDNNLWPYGICNINGHTFVYNISPWEICAL